MEGDNRKTVVLFFRFDKIKNSFVQLLSIFVLYNDKKTGNDYSFGTK